MCHLKIIGIALLSVQLVLQVLASDCKATDDLHRHRFPSVIENGNISTSSSECGGYSMFVALSSIGVEAKIEDCLSPRFVGSRNGSSAAALIEGCWEHGTNAYGVRSR